MFRYLTLYSLYLAKVSRKDYSKAIMLGAKLRLTMDFSRCRHKKNSLTKYISDAFFYKHIQINTKVGTHFRYLPENAKLSIVCPTTRIYLNEVYNSPYD
jgi:hypothetical protein